MITDQTPHRKLVCCKNKVAPCNRRGSKKNIIYNKTKLFYFLYVYIFSVRHEYRMRVKINLINVIEYYRPRDWSNKSDYTGVTDKRSGPKDRVKFVGEKNIIYNNNRNNIKREQVRTRYSRFASPSALYKILRRCRPNYTCLYTCRVLDTYIGTVGRHF